MSPGTIDALGYLTQRTFDLFGNLTESKEYATAVSPGYTVTAYVGNVRHRRPIPPGSLIEVRARIVHTGRTSMHVVVTVSSAEVSTCAYTPATTCVLIFVAKDAEGRTTPVPLLSSNPARAT